MTKPRPKQRALVLCDGAPHRHDDEIERLWAQLRKLINERKRDRCRANCPRKPGYKLTPEHVAAISKGRKGQVVRAGFKRTPAERAKTSAALKIAWVRRKAAATNAGASA